MRTPKCYGYWKSEDPNMRSAILMEQLDAVNLQKVINGTVPVPESFDKDRFLNALSSYLDELHANGIFHLDFFARNVMIDLETGLPRIIDFGRSKFVENTSPEDRKQFSREEWDHLAEIEEKVEALKT